MVQIYLMIFLRLVSVPALQGDFLTHQWLYDFLTAGGALLRSLPFELMKINLLLAVYLWAMSRTLSFRRETVQRLSLLGAALVLVALQLAWSGSFELIRPRFDLVRLPVGRVEPCPDDGSTDTGSEPRNTNAAGGPAGTPQLRPNRT